MGLLRDGPVVGNICVSREAISGSVHFLLFQLVTPPGWGPYSQASLARPPFSAAETRTGPRSRFFVSGCSELYTSFYYSNLQFCKFE